MRFALIFCVIVALLSGCAGNKVKKAEAFPNMYQEKPLAILVLPAVNKSTAADAPELYSSTIAEPLGNAGFYVMSTEITNKILKNEGMATGEQLLEVPPQKFASAFGADAVLYVTITKWDTSYFVVGGNVTVEIYYQLKSAKTGETIWNNNNKVVINTGGDSGGGLLGAIIATAIKTSMQDYVPVARNVNLMSISSIPFGKYHQEHEKDRNVMVIKQRVNQEASGL